VTDLWSLFDFLMPGFLGTQRHFNERYGKPILASRDPKSTAREQEAGALALEALHRQVMPFLLRRMKEDVLADLPPKIIQDYYCELGPMQVGTGCGAPGKVNHGANPGPRVRLEGKAYSASSTTSLASRTAAPRPRRTTP